MNRRTQQILANSITEAEFQQKLIHFAQLHGWAVMHTRPGRTSKGWRTNIAGDGIGFFDLVLMRDRVIFAELKKQNGRQTPHQKAWYERAKHANAEAYVWRPLDWPEIERTLTRKGHPNEQTHTSAND